jgi:hypothetical protein
MGPDSDAALLELAMEIVEAVLEPGAFERELEILEADLEQLLVGQRGLGKLPTRHGALEPETNQCLDGVTRGHWRQPQNPRRRTEWLRQKRPSRAAGGGD